MKKYYKIYKYQNGYLIINFVGEETKGNINEQEIETLLDTFLGTLTSFIDISEIVFWLRNVLKDYDEQNMFVSIKIGNIQKKVMFENKELILYHIEEKTNIDDNEVCYITNFTQPFNLSSNICGNDFSKLSYPSLLEYNEKIKVVMNEIFSLKENAKIDSLEDNLELSRIKAEH